ncbi:MAG: LysM peptidoglycan-binding domain-containing protein [Acidimicrobiales bacterium]|jgi:LysM repeat protein
MRAPRPSTITAAVITLTAIALAGCAGANNQADEESAAAGSTTVPVVSTTTTTEAPRQIYTVRNGDTLVRIANRFDIDLNALVAENGIPDPTRIFVGQQLLIPPPAGEERGPLLTVPPPTRPDLPPLRPTITAQ